MFLSLSDRHSRSIGGFSKREIDNCSRVCSTSIIENDLLNLAIASFHRCLYFTFVVPLINAENSMLMGGVRKNGHDLKLSSPDIHSSVCETSVVERQNATREKKKSSDEAERAFDRRETR